MGNDRELSFSGQAKLFQQPGGQHTLLVESKDVRMTVTAPDLGAVEGVCVFPNAYVNVRYKLGEALLIEFVPQNP